MSTADMLGLVGGTFRNTEGAVVTEIRFDACIDSEGFGTVYRGWHLGRNEQVAIKCLRLSKLADEDAAAERFRATAGEALESPHVVRVIERGQVFAPATGERLPYVVLEWLEARTLREHLVERRERGLRGRTLPETLALLEGAVAGLAYAHQRGVFHRNVEPANLLVVRDGDGLRVKVADFGIAAALGTELDSVYRSPEQQANDLGDVGAWTDIYSLALVMLEVMSGNPIEPRPGLRAIDVGVTLPTPIDDLLARAVAEIPLARPANVEVFWSALRELAASDGRAAVTFEGPGRLTPADPSPFFTGTMMMVNAPGGALHLMTPAEIGAGDEAALGSTEPLALPIASPLASSLGSSVKSPLAPSGELLKRTALLTDARRAVADALQKAERQSNAPPAGPRATFTTSGSPEAIAARAGLGPSTQRSISPSNVSAARPGSNPPPRMPSHVALPAIQPRAHSNAAMPAVRTSPPPPSPAIASPPEVGPSTPTLPSLAAKPRSATLLVVVLVVLLLAIAVIAIAILIGKPKPG